jgi:hypothetical protein
MSNKALDSTLPVNLAEVKFNELDNWLGVMELDPPNSREEKKAMYDRLLDILADMFESKNKNNHSRVKPLKRKIILKEMRKIIDR